VCWGKFTRQAKKTVAFNFFCFLLTVRFLICDKLLLAAATCKVQITFEIAVLKHASGSKATDKTKMLQLSLFDLKIICFLSTLYSCLL